MSEPTKLFHARFNVRPTPQHPCYFEIQFAVLHVLLFGENNQDVSRRALTIVQQLPYEISKTPFWVCDWSAAALQGMPPVAQYALATAVIHARCKGLGSALIYAEPGSDEPDGVKF